MKQSKTMMRIGTLCFRLMWIPFSIMWIPFTIMMIGSPSHYWGSLSGYWEILPGYGRYALVVFSLFFFAMIVLMLAAFVFQVGALIIDRLESRSNLDRGLPTKAGNVWEIDVNMVGVSEQRTQPQDDPAGRLRALKQLVDSGLITEQEYDAKRAEILSKM